MYIFTSDNSISDRAFYVVIRKQNTNIALTDQLIKILIFFYLIPLHPKCAMPQTMSNLLIKLSAHIFYK